MRREVAITGLGAVTPLGVGARTLHERWTAGQSGIQDGEGAATEFEPTEYLTKKEVRRADRFTQFALVASDEALREAGWEGEKPYDPDRIGCIIGTGIGGIGTLDAQPPGPARAGPGEGLPARHPADDGQRGRRRGRACATACAGRRTRPCRRAPPARTRSATPRG